MKNKFLIGIFLIFIIITFLLLNKDKKEYYDTSIAEKRDIVLEVNLTGIVKAQENVDLAFLVGGEIQSIFVDVGDEVKKGHKLVSLKSDELLAKLSESLAKITATESALKKQKAIKKAEEAILKDIKKGATTEEITLAKTKVANSEKALNDTIINLNNVKIKADNDLKNLYKEIDDILNDAYSKADNTITKQISDLFTENTPGIFYLSFSISNQSLKSELEADRINMSNKIKTLKDLSTKQEEKNESDLSEAKKQLKEIRDFLIKLNTSIDLSTNLNSSTTNLYKEYINTSRNNTNKSISDINNQFQAISSQKIINENNISVAQSQVTLSENNLKLAKNELSIKEVGATEEQIEAQKQKIIQAEANIAQAEAQIKQAKAQSDNLKAQINKTKLLSPINGIITKQDAKVGEIAVPNKNIISIMSKNNFEIEVNIPEIDIAKVKVGDPARIYLDAYGDDVLFKATVIKIDPAETIIDGVSTYQATLLFEDENKKIKPGMTANIDIKTAERKNALSIPQRSIINKDEKKIVRLLKDGEIKEREVKTGLKGSYGNIEILEGLKEGDEVVVFMR